MLRGIALLGILPVNLYAFGLPMEPSDDVVHFMSSARSETVAFGLVNAVFQEKFITIFALLFGVGLALQHARAGEGFYPRTLWRLVLLACLGLAHALGLWFGDILFTYAAVGCVALALVWAPPRVLLPLGVMCFLIPPLLMLSFAGMVGMMGIPEEVAGPRTLEQALARPDLHGTNGIVGVGQEIAAFRGGTYGEMFVIRARMWGVMLVAIVLVYGWRLLALFFLGIAGHKLGLTRPGPTQRRVLGVVLAVGLLVGVPIEVFNTLMRVREPTSLAYVMRLEALHGFGSLSLALAYASAVLLLPADRLGRAPLRWFGDVGRLALSNYLGQTIMCTTIFYSYGLGWFATLTRAQLLLVAVGVWTVQLVVSALWLRWFVMGPIEWAWRSLTWGKVEPLRRRARPLTSRP